MPVPVFFAFVWMKRQSQRHGSRFANWSLASGGITFSCIHSDQEEGSEERPEGIQVAHRPPASHHLAFPHQQLARIRKKSPECGICRRRHLGDIQAERGCQGWSVSSIRKLSSNGQGLWIAAMTSWPLMWLSQREGVGSARNGISVGDLKVEFENPK